MTVGNSARVQLNMAQVQTKYGDQLTQLYKTKYANRYESAAKSLDDLMNSSALKGKSDIFREQFSNLYKNIYGIKDDSAEDDGSTATAQSVKTTTSAAGSAASAMKSMANSLEYGGEINLDTYKTQAQGFIDSYNAMVDKLGKADNQAVLQKGVLMINTAKVYSSALNRAGITLGADNKLTLQDDLSKVSASDVKSTFGTHGFSDKVIQKAGQINQLSGGSGYFAAYFPSSSIGSSTTDKVNNPIAVKTAASDVEKAASSLKLYLKDIGADGSDKKFDSKEYADSAKKFVEGFNKMLDETAKSSSTSVNMKGLSMRSVANSYKYALKRAGIEVGSDNKLTVADDIENKTAADAKYAFGTGSFLDKVTQKAQQASALANSAREMGYNANSGYNYAYTSGALYSVYA